MGKRKGGGGNRMDGGGIRNKEKGGMYAIGIGEK
jgi:hypothetical protein